MFIYSALFILKDSISERHISSMGMGLDGTNVQREVAEHLDRQTRVRAALWIFASVFVSKLPAYTDFWNHLPQQVDFFKCGPRKNVPKSLTDLDTELLVSSDALFNQKRRLLKRLLLVEDGFGDTRQEICEQAYSRFLWRRMLCYTSQGVGEIEHISNGQPVDLADRARLYEQNDAERTYGSLRPSSVNFIIVLSVYIHRIPGLCPYNDREYLKQPEDVWHDMNFLVYQIHESQRLRPGTVGCVKASERWLKLASLLGDAAYLMARTDEVESRAFLDVESLVESGTDDEFSRLHRLLSRNGSWIRATCVQLDGLVQALGHVFDTNQLGRTRALHRLLNRKCRIAFGEIVSLEGGGKLSHIQQLVLEDMKRKLLDLLPPPSEAEKGHGWAREIFEFAILETIEEISRGKGEAPAEGHMIRWIFHLIKLIMTKFLSMYSQIIWESSTIREEAKKAEPDRCTVCILEAMLKFVNWFVFSGFRLDEMQQGLREEALKAFHGIIYN
ncbi:hypothetical protein LCI18_000790 [Fusarium solani-melongenae]|uniref:Uncharacterized protein n=1 Tax=Fusarium solani subsp. cucurbitae TaxID=2747967 RepID=A0ACD3YLQ4_FUSSC|nr:hypothetical protein LCI18_000790 [Fusarium solani-melongenae]